MKDRRFSVEAVVGRARGLRARLGDVLERATVGAKGVEVGIQDAASGAAVARRVFDDVRRLVAGDRSVAPVEVGDAGAAPPGAVPPGSDGVKQAEPPSSVGSVSASTLVDLPPLDVSLPLDEFMPGEESSIADLPALASDVQMSGHDAGGAPVSPILFEALAVAGRTVRKLELSVAAAEVVERRVLHVADSATSNVAAMFGRARAAEREVVGAIEKAVASAKSAEAQVTAKLGRAIGDAEALVTKLDQAARGARVRDAGIVEERPADPPSRTEATTRAPSASEGAPPPHGSAPSGSDVDRAPPAADVPRTRPAEASATGTSGTGASVKRERSSGDVRDLAFYHRAAVTVAAALLTPMSVAERTDEEHAIRTAEVVARVLDTGTVPNGYVTPAYRAAMVQTLYYDHERAVFASAVGRAWDSRDDVYVGGGVSGRHPVQTGDADRNYRSMQLQQHTEMHRRAGKVGGRNSVGPVGTVEQIQADSDLLLSSLKDASDAVREVALQATVLRLAALGRTVTGAHPEDAIGVAVCELGRSFLLARKYGLDA